MLKKLIIDPVNSIIGNEHIIYVMRFTFKNEISESDFINKAQDILYDEIGSSGHFRMAPKNKADLNHDFVVGCGKGARVNEYYQPNNNELVVSFCVSENGTLDMNEELIVNASELSLFCEQINASVEQIDVRKMY
jgi:hypothetical protein